jgi:capsular polysaccharide biosynthesis protein
MNINPKSATSTEEVMEVLQDEHIISLRDLLQILRRRLWIILLAMVVAVGGVVGLSLQQTPLYTASTLVLVGQELQREDMNNLAGDIQGLQLAAETVSAAVDTRPVAEGVVEQLELQRSAESVRANLSTQPVEDTQFIEITYTDTDPERAQEIVNSVGEVLSEEISEISPSANALTATVWERADVPEVPVSPNPARNGFLALILGIMLGIALAFLLEFLDDSWRSPEEVEQVSGVPTFGIIPSFKTAPRTKKKGR